MKLAAARVFVHELAAAEAFYKVKLGLSLVAGGIDYGFCVFQTGGCQLVVEPVASDAPTEDQELVGRFTGLSFSVKDIRALCAELSANGVQFAGQPEVQAWGGVLATLVDPSGNKLQLVQYPSAA
jgi:catechol 2,3-dioxygenase-like lactoylglutathione lyase family enzyme